MSLVRNYMNITIIIEVNQENWIRNTIFLWTKLYYFKYNDHNVQMTGKCWGRISLKLCGIRTTECGTPPYAYLITLISTRRLRIVIRCKQGVKDKAEGTRQRNSIAWSLLANMWKIPPSLLILFFHSVTVSSSTITITKRRSLVGGDVRSAETISRWIQCILRTSTILIGLATACTRATTFSARWHIKRSPSRIWILHCACTRKAHGKAGNKMECYLTECQGNPQWKTGTIIEPIWSNNHYSLHTMPTMALSNVVAFYIFGQRLELKSHHMSYFF